MCRCNLSANSDLDGIFKYLPHINVSFLQSIHSFVVPVLLIKLRHCDKHGTFVFFLLYWQTPQWRIAVLTTWCQTSISLAFLQLCGPRSSSSSSNTAFMLSVLNFVCCVWLCQGLCVIWIWIWIVVGRAPNWDITLSDTTKLGTDSQTLSRWP